MSDDDENVRFKYTYKDPREEGYVLTKITLRDLKRIKLSRNYNPLFMKAEVYWRESDDVYNMQYLTAPTGKAIVTLLLPVSLICFGILNAKEILTDYRRSMQEKKYGGFSSDKVFKRDRVHPMIESLRIRRGVRSAR